MDRLSSATMHAPSVHCSDSSAPAPDVEAVHRATLLVLACHLTGGFSAAYAVLHACARFTVGAVTMAVVTVAFFALPPLLRRTGSTPTVAHLFVLVGVVAIVVPTYFSGGEAILPWLAAVPIVGVLLGGMRAGLWWTVASVALTALFTVLWQHGHVFPDPLLPSMRPVWMLLVRVGLPCIVFGLALVFQREKERAFGAFHARHSELAEALDELEQAQARLVQQEKLASLGQLTAGIAHEIKNPLNFVTNFSAFNVELAGELRVALRDGNLAVAKELLDEVEANAGRVHRHGRRADAIVQAMLAHAQTERGVREVVDLNALVAEQAERVACRPSERPFDARVAIEIAPGASVGTVEVAREEIARALQNVIDNAVYAAGSIPSCPDRPPRVRVETARERGAVVVRVRDTGPGVPPELRARVFEPFFTTKPSGEGIGLGLSLSHEIVHARHGGTLDVEDDPAGGTVVVLTLPDGGAA